MDESKVKDIIEWPTASSIQKFRSLHGLVTFYKRFIRNFSTDVTHLTC
jgi:hypothetical protein